MKTGYVHRLGPGPDPVRPQGPVHQAAGPGPYLHGAGPTISGPDPRTSLWGPVRSEVRKGQDRTADSLRRSLMSDFRVNVLLLCERCFQHEVILNRSSPLNAVQVNHIKFLEGLKMS